MSFVAVGTLLVLLGLGLLGWVFLSRPDPAGPEPVPMVIEERRETSGPSRAWAMAGGLTLAAGAACIGIGLNRWKTY